MEELSSSLSIPPEKKGPWFSAALCMSIGSEDSREREVNFCSQGCGSDATVYFKAASLGRYFPSHSRGWMQFANHARPAHQLLSVHQGIFPGMAIKMIPGWTETCWRASRREEQQGRAGPELNDNRLVTAEAEKMAGRCILCFWNEAESLQSVCFWLRKGAQQI